MTQNQWAIFIILSLMAISLQLVFAWAIVNSVQYWARKTMQHNTAEGHPSTSHLLSRVTNLEAELDYVYKELKKKSDEIEMLKAPSEKPDFTQTAVEEKAEVSMPKGFVFHQGEGMKNV